MTPDLHRVAAVAAFTSLLSTAAPALAAPPTSEASDTSGSSVWAALVDHRVVFTLKDGQAVRGTVLSVTNDALVCASAIDGLMIVVDAEQIAYVHVEALPGNKALKKPETGKPLIVFGSILTAVGGSLGIASLATSAACLDSEFGGFCAWVSLPLAATGMASLSLGIPFLASGVSKRKKLREARSAAPEMSGFMLPGRNGAVVGFSLRF
jgi:hypothetical protein